MKKLIYLSLLVILIITPELALADYVFPTDMVGNALLESTNAVMIQLTTIAFSLLFYLSLLQFSIKGYGMVIDGEIEKSIGNVAKYIIWVGFVVWMMSPSSSPVRDGLSNGADFIQRTVNFLLGFASKISGGNGSSFDAGYIFNVGLEASHNLIVAVAKAATGSVANVVLTVAMPITGIFDALMLMFMNLVILATAGYIAIKVFMVKLDAAIVIAISPLSFALNGLSALREQGMAPFKNLLTIMYRILILAAIVSAMKVVSDNLTHVLDTASAAGGFTDIWTPIIAAIFGYILLAYMAHRSDGIANGLSSGSSMFSSGDMASSVAAGVAAGMAVATGGAAVGAAAAKGGQSISDLIKSLGDSGSVSNASPTGSGSDVRDIKPTGTPPMSGAAKQPQMSMAEEARKIRQDSIASSNNTSPRVPTLAGIPMNPDGSVASSSGSPRPLPGQSSSHVGASKAANTIDNMVANGQASNPANATAVSDHLKSMSLNDTKSVGETPSSPSGALDSGTGSSAGIGGASSATDQKLDKLLETMGQSKKPTFSDRMSTLNDHVAKEQSTVQANINVNAHDH